MTEGTKPKVLLSKGDFSSRNTLVRLIEATGFDVEIPEPVTVERVIEIFETSRGKYAAVISGMYLDTEKGGEDPKGGVKVVNAAKDAGYSKIAVISGGNKPDELPSDVEFFDVSDVHCNENVVAFLNKPSEEDDSE